MELDPVYGIGIALNCFGFVYLGAVEASYYARKKEIIQRIRLGIPIRSSDYSTRDKMEDTLLLGPHLAERRFKNGKFDNNFSNIDKKILINYKQSL